MQTCVLHSEMQPMAGHASQHGRALALLFLRTKPGLAPVDLFYSLSLIFRHGLFIIACDEQTEDSMTVQISCSWKVELSFGGIFFLTLQYNCGLVNLQKH